MSFSLRTQRVRLYALEEIGVDGFPRGRYTPTADAWAFFQPMSGTDKMRFEGVESTVTAQFTFDAFTTIPARGMIRLLPSTDGEQDYRVIAVVPRRATTDQLVYASSLPEDERPHEILAAPVDTVTISEA
jgi:hypothetical protein